MPLLDRFRSRPAWQNKDADARLAAVRQLGSDQRDVLAAVAREDEDAKVRRAAVRRLDDLSVLAEVAALVPDSWLLERASGEGSAAARRARPHRTASSHRRA